MVSSLRVDGVFFGEPKTPIQLALVPGSYCAVYGEAESGSTAFLELLKERKSDGLTREGDVFGLEPFKPGDTVRTALGRRTKSEDLARSTESITALGLWDHRTTPYRDLSDRLRQRIHLVQRLAAPPGIIVFDRELDGLDRSIAERVFELLAQRRQSGSIVIAATNRPEYLDGSTDVIVLFRNRVGFSGTTTDLKKRFGVSEFQFETTEPGSVSELVKPVAIQVEVEEGIVRFTAPGDQDLAVRLLLEGYGNISVAGVRYPSWSEMISRIEIPFKISRVGLQDDLATSQ